MVKHRSHRPVVAIIGGGFTGAALAANLARNTAGRAVDIVVFEPRARLGAGLAYDTFDPAHRINVPAARMSLVPDDPDDFLHWLAAEGEPRDDPDALAEDGNLYPRRAVFGRYVSDFIAPHLKAGQVHHRRERVGQIVRVGDQWRGHADGGTDILADIPIVATTHPAPCAPQNIAKVLAGHPRYVADSTLQGAQSVIRGDDRVLVIGNGLTAADVIASLRRSGHRGPITAISRRGLRSRGHATTAQEPFGDFVTEPPQTARSLLRQVRIALQQAPAEGRSWHAVFDALRAQGGDIWRALPIAERKRLVRHLRPYWDVHRFRVAPQIDAVIAQGLEHGDVRVLGGSIGKIDHDGETIAAEVRHRHTGKREQLVFDACVITTGPAHTGILRSQRWLADLADAGYLQLDTVGLGLACDEQSRATNRDGNGDDTLFIAGPLARGTFGELMGLPQVNDHAIFVADQIAQRLARQSRFRAAAKTA
ncbi:hydroxyacylglutathione hydrolase [Ensifer adhaerens]|uniref:Hydroxyacylglutathione hydrolase n=1 Tax=Ensifer adhaerens TaxID=106592 RepID=A0A0L8BFB4_ENSAD|nr:FAD/NAD(P)-binding protein [Ensifer adhaerens]KOF13381.1 hydroxyacylglutathione hydrolase [Ensifer adhaerens]